MTVSERSPWTAVRTSDLDEAHAHLSAAYMEIHVRRSVPQQTFSLDTRIARLGAASVRDDCRRGIGTLPHQLLRDGARSRAEVPAGAPVRFESARPVSRALERHWLSSVAYVQRAILADPVLASHTLITGQAQRLLAATALTVLRCFSSSA